MRVQEVIPRNLAGVQVAKSQQLLIWARWVLFASASSVIQAQNSKFQADILK